MKEILETMPRIELALIIIGTAALMLGIIFGYLLFLTSIFIMSLNLLYFLEWVPAQMDELA